MISVDILGAVAEVEALGRWGDSFQVSIEATVRSAGDDPMYQTSVRAEIRNVLSLGHFEAFRDQLTTYLEGGVGSELVLGGERAPEVRLEMPSLDELALGSSVVVVVADSNQDPCLSLLFPLEIADLQTALQSLDQVLGQSQHSPR